MSQLRQLASPGCGPDEVAQVKSVASLPRPPKAKEYVMNSDMSYRTRGRPTLPAFFAGGWADSFQPLLAYPRLDQRFPKSLLPDGLRLTTRR
jgi:hypothetical protein